MCIGGRNDLWLRTRSSHIQGPVSLPWGTSKGQTGHGRMGDPFALWVLQLYPLFLHPVSTLPRSSCIVRNPILNPNCPVALLFVVSVMYCVTCVSDPWSSHILHYYGFLLHIIEHCCPLCTISPSAPGTSQVMGVAEPTHCPFLQDWRLRGKLWIFGRKVLIVKRVSCLYVSFVP